MKNRFTFKRIRLPKHRTGLAGLLISITSVLTAFLAAATPVLAATQTWYLTDTASGANRVMNKGAVGGGQTIVTVTNGTSVIWVANQAAQGAVGFPAGTWSGQVIGTCVNVNATYILTADIGVWSGAIFTSSGTSAAMTFTKNKTVTRTFVISASAVDVLDTQWLALRLNGTGTGPVGVETSAANPSYVSSPSSDPGYPVPDVASIAMFGAGLAVFFVYYKYGLKPQLRRAR